MAEHQRKPKVGRSTLAELRKAEDDLRIAIQQTQGVIDAYPSMSSSDGDFALEKVLKLQHQAMDKYVAMCRLFTKSMLEGALPDKGRVVKFDSQRQHGQSQVAKS